MKKSISLIILLSVVFTAKLQSQVLMTLLFGDKLNNGGIEFGISGGGNFGTIGGIETTDYYNDWNLGFYFNIRLKETHWYIYTGTLVKAKTGATLSEQAVQDIGLNIYPYDGTYSQKIDYFIVPAFMKYRFDNRFHIEAGPQFQLMYKAKVEFEYAENENSVIVNQDNEDDMRRIDAGIGLGIGYRFNDKSTGATIGLKYYQGLVNVYKDVSGTKNSTFFLQIDIPIGASDCAQQKKKEKADKKAEKKAKKKAKKEATDK